MPSSRPRRGGGPGHAVGGCSLGSAVLTTARIRQPTPGTESPRTGYPSNSIAAWYVGRRSGLSFAFASGVAWYLSDRLSLHPYSRAFFIYRETFMRLVSFLTTALALNKIRELASAHVLLRT